MGEMILFEAQHRTMFFGKLAGADSQSAVLPQTVPRTPDNHIGRMVDGQNVGRASCWPTIPPVTKRRSGRPTRTTAERNRP